MPAPPSLLGKGVGGLGSGINPSPGPSPKRGGGKDWEERVSGGRAVPARLAGMMFLHYFVMGAWIVTLTTFLLAKPGAGLNFEPEVAIGSPAEKY